MDQYLKAIQEAEKQITLLCQRKEKIQKIQETKKSLLEKEKREESKIDESLQEEEKRKYFLDHKRDLLKEYFKKALSFGLRTTAIFFLFFLGVKWLEAPPFDFPVFEMMKCFLVMMTVLGGTEFRFVSQDFRKLTKGYNGDVDEEIESFHQRKKASQEKQQELTVQLQENAVLLEEIVLAQQQIEKQVGELREERQRQIEKLIENLDTYLPHREFPTIEISKLLEKKIH